MKRKISAISDQFRGDDLKARCARSSVVLGTGAFIAKFLGFGSKVILTRLLAPEAMGLMVLIISLTALFEALTEVGIKQSVIQNKKGAQREYLNMAWWFQSLRGIGLYAVAFIVAPWICQFYFDKPELLALHTKAELVTMVRVAFLAYLFYGFVSPRIHVLEREFKFGKSVLIKQGSWILGTILTIILAFTMRNVWAIVIGHVSSTLLVCMFSFIVCPFRPAIKYDRESFQELYGFARGVLGIPILTYFVFNIDVLMAGKLVSADLVGMYGMALVLARAPLDLFGRIVNPLLLPAFAEKQDNYDTLCEAVLRLTRIITSIGIPMIVLAIMFSETIISTVFGEQYQAVALPFSLLCIYALFIMIGLILCGVFYGIGRPEKQRISILINAVVLALFIYPSVRLFNVAGSAAILLIANFIALCFQFNLIRKTIGLKTYNFVISCFPGIGMGFAILISIIFLKCITITS